MDYTVQAETHKTHQLASHASQQSSHGLRLLKLLWQDVQADNCIDLAAEMSYYFVMSLFPFLLVVAAVIGWLPSTNLWQNFAQWVTAYLPYGSRHVVFETVLALTHGSSSFLSIGLAGTIWAASSGFISLMDSLNIAYEAKETRGFWKRRLIAFAAIAVAGVFLVASFGLVTFGKWAHTMLSSDLTLIRTFHVPFEIARWVGTFVLLCIGLDLVDHFLPNVRRPWRWLTPGRLFVASMFVAASAGFNFYLGHFGNYSRIYGALAGAIILLLWIYIASLILLVGAEIDRAIERLEPEGKSM
jgi:membrane protein